MVLQYCPACDSMLNNVEEETVGDATTAVLSCRKCPYKQPLSSNTPVVYEHILQEDKTARLVLNPYLKFDPTLNHLSNIQCPNEDCLSRSNSVDWDVVAVKIDEKKLIWLYICVHCDTTWKQASCLH
jgi:DNA-directed RNA polymerase subunit M/transcription elongation factor TFIIS